MSTTGQHRDGAEKCRCCPYGFHIDVDFVAYAEDVRKGGTSRTPTLSRKHTGERPLMSPLDSIFRPSNWDVRRRMVIFADSSCSVVGLFGDSLENILSDFDDALGVTNGVSNSAKAVHDGRFDSLRRVRHPFDTIETQSRTLPRGLDTVSSAKRQNGYASDYTGYYTAPNAPPKPPHRATTNGRSITPSRLTNGAYTALGRTITEIKARNTESPFPERDVTSRIGSRVGTPIDLGVPAVHNGNASLSRPRTPYRADAERDKFFNEPPPPPPPTVDRPYHLISNGNLSNWRRIPVEEPPRTPSEPPPPRTNGCMGDFASLRRGREIAVSDAAETTSNRVRYYSASPKMPRKLQAVPPLPSPSQFTYTHQNGNTMLAKTQGTSMSPQPPAEIEKVPPPKEMVTVGVNTGPVPPVKPCSECGPLRKELQELLKRLTLAEAKPTVVSVAMATDVVPTVEVAVGETTLCYSIGTETDHHDTVECGCDALGVESQSTECQTTTAVMTEIGVGVETSVADVDLQTDDQLTPRTHFGVNTDEVEKPPEVEKADQATVTEEIPALKAEVVDQETMTIPKYFRNIPSQTIALEEVVEDREVILPTESPTTAASSDAECQTETDSTVDSTASDDVAGDAAVVTNCPRCRQREETFTRNVGVGACSVADKVCIECDKATPEEVDENDAPGFKVEKDETRSKDFDRARAVAVKKLLTSEQKQPFVRGTAVSRSARIERNKGDHLEYITEKNKSSSVAPPTPATTPSGETADALKSKVVLKKEIPVPPSNLPEPVPARIPRPKISKYAVPAENAETPDEEEEAADRLTPLRSELRSLGRWPRSNANTQVPYSPYKTGSESDEDSDDSEGSYDTHEDGVDYEDSPYEITIPMREAMESLNSHLLQPGSITSETADWALKYVQHEWLKCTARKSSRPEAVDVLIEQLKELSPALLKVVVNITDQNGNTALHYAVSHGNFGVVSSLLDSGECQLNLANRAGYSAVMLAALSSLENEVEKAVVQRLFEHGDVNARAQQHGQTALMLSVSHGKKSTTELLLACGADVNLQDEEGSTALMCAAEHGHKDIVKLLLSQPGVDASLTDCDSSTALSIAVENGHRDIGVLIYAHLNYSQAETIDDA